MTTSTGPGSRARITRRLSFITASAAPGVLLGALVVCLVSFTMLGMVLAVGAIEDEVREPHRNADDAEVASLDMLRERGAALTVPKNTAVKVSCGGTAAHASWVCKSRTPASIIYRGGSDVALDGGTGSVWCDGTALDDCIDDVITGDSAHAWLATFVDAGVTLGCTCAYK